MEKLRAIDSEKLYSREDIREELKKHNKCFDLEKFYLDNVNYSFVNVTGFSIITPNQMFDCFCYPYSEKHEHIIENILFSIFEDYNDVFRFCNFEWRSACEEFGVIAIQLLAKYYSFIWMPKRINSFQYNCFLEFYERISNYRSKGIEIDICVNFKLDDGKDLNMSLDEAIKYVKNIVIDDFAYYDETVLEDGRTLTKGRKWTKKN